MTTVASGSKQVILIEEAVHVKPSILGKLPNPLTKLDNRRSDAKELMHSTQASQKYKKYL